MESQITTKKPFICIKEDRDFTRTLFLFLTAAALIAIVYIARIFHLLEEPLFSLVYYGNLNGIFYAGCATILYVGAAIAAHHVAKNCLDYKIFGNKKQPIGIVRRAIIYSIVLGFALGISIYLDFTLKVVYELGEKITGMQLLSNGLSYIMESAKILLAVCVIALAQEAFDSIFETKIPLPFGGLFLFLTYGVLELIFNYTDFSPIYLIFTFVYGIIYLLTYNRALLTFAVCVILFLL